MKEGLGILGILLAGLFIFAGSVSSQSPECSNLVVLYHFDGDASDSAGNNDGIVKGATYTTSGKFDYAIEFDGSGDYVNIDDAPDLDNFYQALTVSVWAKGNSWNSPDHNPLIWKGSQIGWGPYYNFRIALSSGSPTWGVTCGTTEGWFRGGSVSLDQWYNYVLTFDGTTTRAYVDGAQVGSSTGCSGQTLNSMAGYPVRLGFAYRSSTSEETYFNGAIDEVAIWNTSLSAQEVSEIYDSNSPITCGAESSCSAVDVNSNSVVEINELINYISNWKIGIISSDEAITAINEWKGGC